ncbi:hypothetical protein NQ317_005998, partial [Molorchus minor]
LLTMPQERQNRKRKHEPKTQDDDVECEIDVPKHKFCPFDEEAQIEEEHLSKILFGGARSFLQSLEEAELETGPSCSNTDSGVGEEDSSDSSETIRKPAWIDDDDDGIEVGQALNVQRRKLPSGGINSRDNKYSDLLKHKFQTVVGTPKWASLDKSKQSESDSDEEVLQHSGTLEFKKVKDLNCETYSEGPYINTVEFHQSSSVALIAGNSDVATLCAVDGKRNNKLHSVAFERFPNFCAKFIHGGNEAILGSRHSHIFSYDLLAAKPIRINLPHGMTQFKSFTVSPDSQFIASAGKWGEVHILTADSKERVALLKQNSEARALSFNPSAIYCNPFIETLRKVLYGINFTYGKIHRKSIPGVFPLKDEIRLWRKRIS